MFLTETIISEFDDLHRARSNDALDKAADIVAQIVVLLHALDDLDDESCH